MKKVISFIYRNYWVDETQSSYGGVLHSMSDDRDKSFQLYQLSRELDELGIEDGEILEITLRRIKKKPFPNRIWKLVKPHTYAPVEKPVSKSEGTY